MWNSATLFLAFLVLNHAEAFSADLNDRRSIIGGGIGLLVTTAIPSTSLVPSEGSTVASAAGMPPSYGSGGGGGIQGVGGMTTRVEGIGGGFDITSSTTTTGIDAIYPESMEGSWKCRRAVTSVEGDAGQAELAWRILGGTGDFKKAESFATNYILPPQGSGVKNDYRGVENDQFYGVVLDRGFEMAARTSASLSTTPAASLEKMRWSIGEPDILQYEREGGKDNGDIEVAVVQRKVEMPSEKGFGFNELYRVSSSAGGIFSGNKVQRAIRVSRRYRRVFDENGNRVVEGLEIMKTYRVLDGIAGVEMPTSTTKSQIQLTRINV